VKPRVAKHSKADVIEHRENGVTGEALALSYWPRLLLQPPVVRMKRGDKFTKRIAGVILLAIIAFSALAVKSWWNSEDSGADRQVIKQKLSELKDRQQNLTEALDSMRTATLSQIDSLRGWVESQATAAVEGEVKSQMDRARQAWDKVVSSLPSDLSRYERRVAIKELRETLENWFDLDRSQLRIITGDA